MLFAHGVGSRGDLPLPLWMFTWGAAIALGLSFVALGVLWKEPRLAQAAIGRRLLGDRIPAWLGGLRGIGQVVALGLLLLCLWAGFFGADTDAQNVLPVTFYVVAWVGAQLIAGLFGDVWRAISPFTTIARGVEVIASRLGMAVTDAPPRLGHLPAAAGMFVFLFIELAHPSGSSPRVLAWALLVHIVVIIVLTLRWGASWIADNEPFGALLAMIGAMGIVARSAATGVGRFSPGSETASGLTARAPMSGLATTPVLRGTLATLLVVLGGTTFDGFVESEAGRDIFGRPSGWGGAVTLTIGLILSILLVTALFGVGIRWTCKVTGLDPEWVTDSFTPSLVPIVFGYAIAHYAQLLADEVQTFWFRLSDPAGLGWNLFGQADSTANLTWLSPTAIAWIQVLAILFGHIGAVLVAHDRSMEIVDHNTSTGSVNALRSQYVMLLVMVLYSCLGLWLLNNA